MSKAILTLTDTEDGRIDIKVTFEPALQESSSAHHLAARALRFIAGQDSDEEEEDDQSS